MRRSICFPFPTLENRTKIDWEPVMGSRTIHAKLGRICNHVGAEKTNWIGGGVEWSGGGTVWRKYFELLSFEFAYQSSFIILVREKKKITSTSFWFFAYSSWSLFLFFRRALIGPETNSNRFCTRSIPFSPTLSRMLARLCTAKTYLLFLFIFFFFFFFFVFSKRGLSSCVFASLREDKKNIP